MSMENTSSYDQSLREGLNAAPDRFTVDASNPSPNPGGPDPAPAGPNPVEYPNPVE